MNCEFLTPINYLGGTPREGEFWQFQEMSCVDETKELIIQNEKEFYLDKTFSYGDVLIVLFLSFFLIFGIFKLIWHFVWEQKL